MTKYLFVYGTLLPHEAPAELRNTIRHLRRVGKGRTRGRLFDFGEFPGAFFNGSSGDMVRGLVYELPSKPEILQQFDSYEGFDPQHPQQSLFLRKRKLITVDDGPKLLSWVYEYNGDPASGIYLRNGKYKGRKKRAA